MVAISPLDIFHSRIFWARRSSFSKHSIEAWRRRKRRQNESIFPWSPSLSHFSRVLWWNSERERKQSESERERETTAWGEWSLPPLIKLHLKPSSFFISTTHLSLSFYISSVHFSTAQHSRSGMRILCVLLYFLHIYLVLLPMEIFPSKLIEGVVVVSAFSLREF